ncbi:MAG TPA: hypothetical protein VH414_04220 [Lichenihabitans sp.]|nr:hypothetical protein [Lichenihabitans sp.]
MNKHAGARSLRRIVIATTAALGFAVVAQSIEPAQALPVASSIISRSGTAAIPTIEHAAYYGYNDRYYPRYRHRHYGRYYGYARRGQCRYNGVNSHLSKRYCRVP